MVETDVALTDYAIFVECVLFVGLLGYFRRPSGPRNYFIALFLFTGAAAATGGTVHGFFVNHAIGTPAVLWILTLWLIGAASIAMWMLAASLCLARRWVLVILLAGVAEWLAYAMYVLWVDRSFSVAVVQYVPAAAALLVAMTVHYRRSRDFSLVGAMAGLVLTFVAGALQQIGFSPAPAQLTHNAFYHLLQIVALLAVFFTALTFPMIGQPEESRCGPA